jgi:hypothetical protein
MHGINDQRFDSFVNNREQRASALLMSIFAGLSVFFTHILGVRTFDCARLASTTDLIVLVHSNARSLRCIHVHGCVSIAKHAGWSSQLMPLFQSTAFIIG